MTWIEEQQTAVLDVARIYTRLRVGSVGGLTNAMSSGQVRHTALASPELPIDPRPIDLAKDIRRWSEDADSLTRGTLRLGVRRHLVTPQLRLQTVADLLPQVEQADPDLARDLGKQAHRLRNRWQTIINQAEPEWISLDQACTECDGPLRASTSDWHVECVACGAVWTQDAMLRALEAVHG